MATVSPPILIIGAGISGLTLAQACRKRDLPFRIFERDENADVRRAGWALTLHWSLSTLRALLPQDILDRLPEAYVNRRAVEAGERGDFTFFDLSTGQAKWKVPASERIRVSRGGLSRVLRRGLDVEWSQTLVDVVADDAGATAFFSDGTSARGSVLVACDGANSVVRRLLHPGDYQNTQLPVRFIGADVRYSESDIEDIRRLDPFFLQGADPRTDAYLWFSFIQVPGDGPTLDRSEDVSTETWRCQIVTSWPYREGFLGRVNPTGAPNTDVGRLSFMQTVSAEWVEPFRSIVQGIPGASEIRPVELADWLPRRADHHKFGGRVVLLGDAAHTMVMYRGEAANHAIVDVAKLLEVIGPLHAESAKGQDLSARFEDAAQKYDDEMVERTHLAVLASRQACIDAHDHMRLNDNSPLVRRRVMRADLENS